MNKGSVVGKILVQGTLVLDEPLLIGDGGKGDDIPQDISVLKNKQGIPYIPGTSLAGVLRAYMKAEHPQITTYLFGSEQGSEDSDKVVLQSSLSIYDVKLNDAHLIIRDGISIDAVTGIAIKHAKYDYEALDRGAHGTLQIEITLRAVHKKYRDYIEDALKKLRQRLLAGFYVGAHTMKGFGKVHVEDLNIDYYDFHQEQDVRAWLFYPDSKPATVHIAPENNIADPIYARDDFVINADFALLHSLIIRDYDKGKRDSTKTENNMSLSAVMKTDSHGNYLIPGTSLKGALKHQALYILHMLEGDISKLDDVMGTSSATIGQQAKQARRSRFRVDEAIISPAKVIVKAQSRNRIDRFTGGTVNTALFTTEPVWQQEQHNAVLSLHFGILNAKNWEAGLALLLLKDLWLGRAAIGGEKSIGRGILQGITAEISYQERKWVIDKDKVLKGNPDELEAFVSALVEEMGK